MSFQESFHVKLPAAKRILVLHPTYARSWPVTLEVSQPQSLPIKVSGERLKIPEPKREAQVHIHICQNGIRCEVPKNQSVGSPRILGNEVTK